MRYKTGRCPSGLVGFRSGSGRVSMQACVRGWVVKWMLHSIFLCWQLSSGLGSLATPLAVGIGIRLRQ